MEFKLTADKEAKLKAVTGAALKEVKPSAKEADELTGRINTVMRRLKAIVAKDVEIMVAGSMARGTNLRGNSDVDIFLLFKKAISKEKMERVSVEVAKKLIKGNRRESYMVKYAEHPYARIFLDDLALRIDLVPAYKISAAKEMRTSVDRTQLHNEFIRSALSIRQQDDVRILKSLLKFHNIYGAEAKVEGFSGYLCELLILSYGSFMKLVDGLGNAKPPLIINLSSNQHDPAVLTKVFQKKLIVIDPTDPNRNVAANVSDESFARLALLCRMLIMYPTDAMFRGMPIGEGSPKAKLSKLTKRLGTTLYVVGFKADDISDEIIWQQLRRLMLGANQELSKLGFPPLISLQEIDGTDAVIGFLMNNSSKAYKVLVGPSALMRDAASAFAVAHANKSVVFRYMENDRLCLVEEAECTTPEEAVRFVVKSMQVPSHFKKGMKVYSKDIPESYAKLVYRAYVKKTTL